MSKLTTEYNGKADLKGYEGQPCGAICEIQSAGCIGCPLQKALDKLKNYEEKEENGLIPKCDIGDSAYFLRTFRGTYHVKKGIVADLYYNKQMKLCAVIKGLGRGMFGDKVFIDLEEANKKCREFNNK